jgi:beta-lactamase class A
MTLHRDGRTTSVGRRSARAALALLVVVALTGLGRVSAQAGPTGLTRLLEAELSRFPARAGLCLRHLPTGEEACVRPDEPFNSASVIKIPVMVMAFQMADEHTLNLNERIEMGPGDYRGGSGVLRFNDVGQRPTIRDVITQMIITSDNSATDLMIARVGGVARINQWLGANGYAGLRITHTAYELFRKQYELIDAKYAGLTPAQLFALGNSDPRFRAGHQALLDEVAATGKAGAAGAEFFERMKTDQDYWLGSMSPRDTMRLLASMEQGQAASRDACEEMMRILRAQQSGARRLPHFLDVPVGHKTGDYPPAVANDVGVIYAHSGPIAIAFFTRDNTGEYPVTEDRIGEVARLVVEYFDGAAKP